MNAAEISRSGLDVEWRRLQVIAQNLANMGSAAANPSEAYKPLHLQSGPAQTFSQKLANGAASPGPSVLAGAQVLAVAPQERAPRTVYEPSNPAAGPDGMVSYPNIDHAGEMTAMVQASRCYEANLVALSSALRMYAKAAEIGRR
jgi:flagellar basal-body rod protein FlgC